MIKELADELTEQGEFETVSFNNKVHAYKYYLIEHECMKCRL